MPLRNVVPAICLLVFVSFPLSAQISFSSVGQQPMTAPQSKTPADQKCSIQGQVTNAVTGERVKKTTVNLQLLTGKSADGTQQGYSTTSSADGSFTFDAVEPGNYNLSGGRQGFLNTEYGKKTMSDPGVVLALKPTDKKTGVNLTLIPNGTISGKIVDEDGDPIAQVMVSALHSMWVNGKPRQMPGGMVQTNDLGEFRLSDLSPGKYYLLAQKIVFQAQTTAATNSDKPDIRPLKTYYPQATALDSATPVAVQAGQDMSGINIQLVTTTTHHVRGTIVGDMGHTDIITLHLSVSEPDDLFSFFSGANGQIKKDRTFDVAGVPPGSHSLVLMDMNSGFKRLASQLIEVGQGDVDNVALQIVPPGTIKGQIVIQGQAPAGASRATPASIHPMLGSEAFAMPPQVTVKDDGTMLIESVAPGKYRVYANPPDGTYIKAINFQRQDVTGQELDLNQNQSGELDIVFRYGTAELGGIVKLSQDPATPPAAEVVLIPEVLNADASGVETGRSDQNGNFTIKNLKPGNYRAIALERVDTQELENPDLLKQLQGMGTAVELKENDKKQLTLDRIPAADIQALLAKLGIEFK